MTKSILILFLILFFKNLSAQEKYTISGHITDENGEPLIGVNVYETKNYKGAVSNIYGFYSLTLPKGDYKITYSFLGYLPQVIEIKLDTDKKQNIALKEDVKELEEVVITEKKEDQNIRDIKMSYISLPTKTLKKIPALMGEVDIIKGIQLLPGVQTSVEGSSGFYVRGGNADQNLILLDGATVYNPSHFFGFFSVFNSDAIKNIELHKGGIPAEYGGRLSSVLDVRMKEGNTEKIKGEAGIGMISSRLVLEGPIIKNKVSFIISGRRTYFDLFLPFAKDTLAQKSKVYFYDLNAKLNWKIGQRDRIFLSGYFGRDVNRFGEMFQMNFGNSTATLRWNHVYNGKLFSNLTLIYSDFDYNLGVPQGTQGFKWLSHIIDYSIKNDYTFYINPENTINFGLQATYHTIKPGIIESLGNDSILNEESFPNAYAIESGIFLSNEQKLGSKLTLLYGLRYSLFQNIGKAEIYSYEKDDYGDYLVSDTTYYKSGDIFETFSGWEPRLSLRYAFNNKSSIKAGYNRTIQYMQLASNSTATFPLDMWFMSSPNVKPQKADQIALGFFKNFFDNMIETSVEVYYKKMYNTVDFKDHAFLVPNRFLEGELRIGSAEAYGFEVLIQKQTGKLSGWISYTYSQITRDVPEVNNGFKYPAPYEKPHDISVVLNYDINKKFDVAANWVYSSAIPVTVPKGGFYYQNVWVPEYSRRGSVRIPGTSYHRLDLSFTWHFKLFKRYDANINASIYNAYNRHNAFAVYFRDKNTAHDKENIDSRSDVEVVKLYLFPIIPSLFNFNIKF